jgi:hypothetical protein
MGENDFAIAQAPASSPPWADGGGVINAVGNTHQARPVHHPPQARGVAASVLGPTFGPGEWVRLGVTPREVTAQANETIVLNHHAFASHGCLQLRQTAATDCRCRSLTST